MKTSFAAVSALVAGIGIGGVGVNSIHAQAKPRFFEPYLMAWLLGRPILCGRAIWRLS